MVLLRSFCVFKSSKPEERHDEALELLDDALTRRTSLVPVQNSRCWFKGLRNVDLAGALADCDRAIELSSNPAAYLDSRAMVHFRAGRLSEARSDLEKTLGLAPELASSRFMLGIVLDRLGMADEGAAETGAARRILPNIDHFFRRYEIVP